MSADRYHEILSRAKGELNHDEQVQLAKELAQYAAAANGPVAQPTDAIDPRDGRMGPATSDFTRRLRKLRKEHLAEGGRLLNIEEIDELVADYQGPLSERD